MIQTTLVVLVEVICWETNKWSVSSFLVFDMLVDFDTIDHGFLGTEVVCRAHCFAVILFLPHWWYAGHCFAVVLFLPRWEVPIQWSLLYEYILSHLFLFFLFAIVVILFCMFLWLVFIYIFTPFKHYMKCYAIYIQLAPKRHQFNVSNLIKFSWHGKKKKSDCRFVQSRENPCMKPGLLN